MSGCRSHMGKLYLSNYLVYFDFIIDKLINLLYYDVTFSYINFAPRFSLTRSPAIDEKEICKWTTMLTLLLNGKSLIRARFYAVYSLL